MELCYLFIYLTFQPVCLSSLKEKKPGVVAPACNPSAQDAETGGSYQVPDLLGLQSELKPV